MAANDPRYPHSPRRRAHSDAWLMDHDQALTVVCPDCRAPIGDACVSTITHEPVRAPAHWQRLRLSGAARPTIPAPRRTERVPHPAAPGGTTDDPYHSEPVG